MNRNRVALYSSFLALLLLAGVGCGGNNALDPKFQPQVANQPDNFQFQTTGVSNVTQTLTYSWSNSGTAASVNQACAITAGTATITLQDGKGNAVYSADLKANGTFTSLQGNTGTWMITVALTKVAGTLNFRVQKV
jgi:hypothetical protein